MATSLFRLGVALVGCVVATLPGFAAEKFKRLTPDEFARQFIDRTVGDDAHWSYHFGTNATVDAMDLGKIRHGLWRFTRGELCMDFTERRNPVAECYEILISGKNVRFLRDGMLIVEGWLLDE